MIGGESQNRTGVYGFAIRCITTMLFRHIKKWSGKRVSNSRPQPWQGCALPTELFPRICLLFECKWSGKRVSNSRPQPWQGCALPTELFPHICLLCKLIGAGNESRTRDLNLGKVALYQLSYSRMLCKSSKRSRHYNACENIVKQFVPNFIEILSTPVSGNKTSTKWSARRR